MWHLVQILVASRLWFSDGRPIEATRGGLGVASRLIVDHQGFLDITEVRSSESAAIDANGATLWLKRRRTSSDFACPSLQDGLHPLNLSLRVDDDGSFTLSLVKMPEIITGETPLSRLIVVMAYKLTSNSLL